MIHRSRYFRDHLRRVVVGSVLCGLAAILAAPAGTRAAARPTPAGWSDRSGLEDYLAAAEDRRPVLVAEEGRSQALRAEAGKAGALPGLKLAWGEMIVPVETRVGPQQRVFSVSQSIPWFGTLGLKAQAAGAVADAADARRMMRRLAVRRQVTLAWLDLAYLDLAIATVAGHLDLAVNAESATRASYEAGRASYADVLTAQIEVGRLEARHAGLIDQRTPALANLNAAAGLDVDTPAPPTVDLAAVPLDDALPDISVLESRLEAHNPELAALRAAQQSRSHAVDLAEKASYPDLMVGVDYIMTGPARMPDVTDSGKDPVIARVAVTVPLWGGHADAERKASAGMMQSAGADLAEARLRLAAELRAAHFALREAARQEALYSATMISRGRQALEVTSARYSAGKAAFQDLIEARRTLLDLELAKLDASTDRRRAYVELITLLGVADDAVTEDG